MATKLDTVVSVILDSKGVAVGVKDINGHIRNIQGQFMKLKDDMETVEKSSEKFSKSLSEYSEKSLRQIEKSTKAVSTQSNSLKGRLEGLFKPVTALNQAFGVLQQSLYIVQRAFSLTVGSAIDLELQVARITTVLEDAEVGQVNFAKQILAMQRTFGANPTEAAQGFYEAIASGATNAAGSLDLMQTAQKLSVGGLLSLDKALSGLTSVMAAYGYEANQTKYISDGFFIAAAKGKTNVEELTLEIGNVSSIAQQANVSFEELVSAISAVTLGGKRTAEATTSVRSAINALLTPTEQLQYVYDQLGITSVTAAIKQRGLQAVYQDIYKYVNFNVEALSRLVGRVEAIPGVVAITTGKQKKAYEEMLVSITDNTKKMGETTDRAFNLIADTASHRMEVAKGSISASLTGISQAFMVILTPIVEFGAKIISSILRPIERISESFIIFSSSVSDHVLPAITMLAAGVAAIKIPALTASFIALGASFKALLIPLAAVSAKFIAITASIIALIAIVDSLIRNFELLTDSFDLFVKKMTVKMNWSGLFNIAGIKEDSGKIQQEIQKTRDDITALENKINKTKFQGGAFQGIADAMSNLFSAFEKAPDLSKVMAPIGMPSLPEGGPQGEAPDLKGAIEEAKKAQEQLNAIIGKTADIEKEIELSKFAGNDQLRESLRLELERVDALAEQVDANKKLTSEQLMAIDKYKEATAKAVEIQINTANLKKAESLVQSAGAGADAVVGNAVTQMASLFGEKGELIAGAINLFRKGEDFMRNLSSELIKIIIELPLKIAEGMVGLVEGLLQGVIDMLGDPARLARIFNAFTTLGPKVMTSIIKALPQLLKALLDPKFWKEFGSQLIRSIWDAIMDLFASIGELFGIKTKKKEKPAAQPQPQMGLTAQTPTVGGYQSQLFSVQEEEQAQKTANLAEKIQQAFNAGIDKSASWWDKLKKLWDKFIITPLKMTWDLMMNVFTTTFNVIMSVFEGVWKTMMSILKGTFNAGVALWKGSLKLFKSIWDAAMGVFKSVIEFFKSIFQGIIDAFKAAFNFIVTLFDDPIQAFKNLWEDLKNIFANIWEKFEGIGDAIGEGISKIWKSLKEMFLKAGEAIWEGLKGAGDAIGQMFKDVGNDIWEGVKKGWDTIKDGFSSIGNYVWDGIKGAFNNIKSFFKNLFKFDGGGKGAVENFLGFDFPWLAFAEGGKVPGSPKVMGDSAKNDTVAALLSPGEFVIPRSKMQDPDNLMLIDAIMSGGKAAEWIAKTLTNGVEAKAIGGAIGNSSYGKWLSKAQSGGIEFHWDIRDLDITDKNSAVRKGAAELDPTNPNSALREGLRQVGDFLMPDWIANLWDSLKRFVSNIDFGKLVSDPLETIKNAIKGSLSFLVEPFKKMMSFNAGGLVPGIGNFDSVPAMLTPGEFVINRNAVNSLGGGLLNQLNQGQTPSNNAAPIFNISLNIETKDALDANFIRNTLVPTIKSELKASSLRGDFVLSAKGVRR